MKVAHIAKLTVVGSILAGMILASSFPSSAVAASPPTFASNLQASGYSVSGGIAIRYANLQAESQVILVERGSSWARVELLQYPSQAKLLEEWVAVNGASPKPKAEVEDFAGRSFYWNNDSILVVDFRAPNDPVIAKEAGELFLSGTAVSKPTIASSLMAAPAQIVVTPPKAGEGGLAARPANRFNWTVITLVAGSLGVIGLATLTQALRLQPRRRRAR